MNRLAILAAALLLSACASGPPPEPPRIERMTAAELAAALPQLTATVSLADIVAMGREGKAAAQIVDRLRESHSRHRLTAGEILDLRDQGVAREVLDYLVDADRQATFDDVAADIARREQACRDTAEQELRQCRLQCFNTWPGMPYGGCWPPRPGYPYWRCF